MAESSKKGYGSERALLLLLLMMMMTAMAQCKYRVSRTSSSFSGFSILCYRERTSPSKSTGRSAGTRTDASAREAIRRDVNNY
jgi:hypothetical protein